MPQLSDTTTKAQVNDGYYSKWFVIITAIFILFGSYAYGQPASDSDVDLLIVMDSDERPATRVTRVSKLLRPRPFPMDILVRTPEEIQHRLEIGDYFIHEIVKRGKVLYERDVFERVGS